jgi:hypothetical protein
MALLFLASFFAMVRFQFFILLRKWIRNISAEIKKDGFEKIELKEKV